MVHVQSITFFALRIFIIVIAANATAFSTGIQSFESTYYLKIFIIIKRQLEQFNTA